MEKRLKYGTFTSLIVLKEIIDLLLQISEGAVTLVRQPHFFPYKVVINNSVIKDKLSYTTHDLIKKLDFIITGGQAGSFIGNGS